MNQYPALTSLRFLAALLVFVFHFRPEGGFWEVLGGEGHVGVSVFFVLSGFLITLRYADEVGRGTVGVRDYFLRRAARILPLYFVVFVLSQYLASGHVALPPSLLPEWTLTQALFGESVNHLVVPTSWSLTVEECFYATAPLLFLAIASVRRRAPRRPLLASAVFLACLTVLLYAAGALLWTVLDGRGPGFLRDPGALTRHTVFGRFFDFASGATAALLFASPTGVRLRRALDRPAVAALLSGLSALGIYASQCGMHASGGIEGPNWPLSCAFSLPLAVASAALILSLTSGANPAARALAARPLVYLGKLSYAFYLIQLTPLGKGLIYPLLPRQSGTLSLLLLYAGLTLVSALLYELVEEPSRKLLLKITGVDRSSRRSRWPLLVRGAIAASLGLLLVSSRGAEGEDAVTLHEIVAAGGGEVRTLSGEVSRRGRDMLVVDIPHHWREGWRGDLRAPSAVWVFADGGPLPFTRREVVAGAPAAFFRGPRAEQLSLRVRELPRAVTIVRVTPLLRTKIDLARIMRSPVPGWLAVAAVAAMLLSGAIALARRRHALAGPPRARHQASPA